MTRSQWYALVAGRYICQLAASVSPEEARRLLSAEAPRLAEDAVNAAVLAGDEAATRAACRAWWTAWKAALAEITTGASLCLTP